MVMYLLYLQRIIKKYISDEMTVYAAQASFFIIMAAFPFIILMLSIIQVIPNISQGDLLELLGPMIPRQFGQILDSVVNSLYTNSPGTLLSLSALAALWSASKGMMSIARGLNRVQGDHSHRGYIITRIICSGYTIVFILVCILSLGLLVFGNMIQEFMVNRFPIIADVTTHIISFRALWAMMILIIFFLGIYTFVPDKKLKLREQIPGAVFSTVGWMAFSFAFSLYFNHIGGKNYSYMYGSLTAIVLLLLWLYMCMCILFFGAEINYYWKELFGRE